MATTVTVLCPNGRRVNIKVTPATSLLQVLEQACEKQKFDAAFHTLKHHNKPLDLNNLFRYTNLPQNAKLEMVPTDRRRTESAEVTVAVQCEDGQRVQGKFDPPATSLWGVLTKLGLCEFEGGRLEPVVAYTNNQICGETALKKVTLKDLGLNSGRVAIRLLFRERQSHPSDIVTSERAELSAEVEVKQQQGDGGSGGGTGEQCASESRESGTVKSEGLASEQEEAMETQPGSDDEQPKRKTTAATYKTNTESKQTGVSDPSQASQTGLSTSTMGSTSDDADIPYFPAHPISYFPDDDSSSSSASARPSPPQPASIFDSQFSLFSIAEDGPVVGVQTLEPFAFPAVSSMLERRSDLRPQRPAPARIYDEPCDRERVVYHLDTSLPSPTVDVPDEFFKVTVEDVQHIRNDHKKQLEAFSDTPLMTQTMRNAQIEKKYESYKKAVVRVHFPDRWVLQGCFRPKESLKALVRFIRDNLADSQVKFHLYTTPPKEVLKNGRMTFIEAGFVPAAIVHVGVESSDTPLPVLSEEILKEAKSGLEAELVVAKKRETSQGSSLSSVSSSHHPRPKSQPATRDSSRSGGGGGAEAGGATRKVPKWFKMGK